MNTTCGDCRRTYDDAVQWTFCPHQPFITDEHCEQKDAAFSLVGKDIYFAHQPEGPYHRVQTINQDGMLTLRDMTGEFSPHLFQVKA